MKNRWSDSEIEFLKAKRPTMTTPQMASKLNRSVYSNEGRLKRLYKSGIPKKTTATEIRHSINRSNLLEDSQEIYYLMGFIAADGNVYRRTITIRLKYSDRHILDDIRRWLEFSGEVKTGFRGGYSGSQKSASLVFISKDFAGRLRSIGITENKSKTIRLCGDIPKEYVGSFIRGVFDGDGSVCRTKDNSFVIYICSSSKGFLEDLQELIGYGKISTNKKMLHMLYIRSYEKKNFFELMYDETKSLCLQRKYTRMKEAYEYVVHQSWKHRDRNLLGQFS